MTRRRSGTSGLDRREWMGRAVATGIGAAAVGLSGGATEVSAQAGFQPARHAKDAWFDTLPGKHRIILDITSFSGAGNGILYANNTFNANQDGYQLANSELAVVLTLRHFATTYAFNDAMWAKYGKNFAGLPGFTPEKPGAIPTANPRNSGSQPALNALVKRGVHFAVCELATKVFSGMIAGEGNDPMPVFNELTSNAIPNAHFMPAGVVAITRAQEYGYRLIYVG